MTQDTISRPDEDILEDIHALMSTYPPLQHDRRALAIRVERGVVTVAGYIKASPTYRYLKSTLPHIKGIRYINADDLYEDDVIRLDVGKVVPLGIQVRVEYGAIVLTGHLPESLSAKDVVKQVALVKGVQRVLTAFA
ncbi:MAG: BON domain-containing protein [Phototrophicales bacterium]|nr:BON domain-containing protein [Phototrophicales bacterium]